MIRTDADLITPVYGNLFIKKFFIHYLNNKGEFINIREFDRNFQFDKKIRYWTNLTKKFPELYPYLKNKLNDDYVKKYQHLGGAVGFGFFD